MIEMIDVHRLSYVTVLKILFIFKNLLTNSCIFNVRIVVHVEANAEVENNEECSSNWQYWEQH